MCALRPRCACSSLRIDRYPQSVKQHASSTVVVCAFGALTTCVYSFTSTYTTYISECRLLQCALSVLDSADCACHCLRGSDATKKAITTRFYHNGAFLAAVVRSFFLVRFGASCRNANDTSAHVPLAYHCRLIPGLLPVARPGDLHAALSGRQLLGHRPYVPELLS